ncbi:hypothetical protein KGF57_003993 [Candida theae]|uniref:Oligomycin resistance ATP-dependent permease YOR1 n=1 Tax=Candida theae TaxID=1198502 RepID=A0AAD5BC32_9ASCO|nr:uncharacterized protein KGF57_003993 [Candida theae]KAI5953784.1 hypothetical protein KGF57_003993 [Candida theae]
MSRNNYKGWDDYQNSSHHIHVPDTIPVRESQNNEYPQTNQQHRNNPYLDIYSSLDSGSETTFTDQRYTLPRYTQRMETIATNSSHEKISSKISHNSANSASSLESQPQLHNEKRLFSWLFSKRVPSIPSEEERKEYPWTKTNAIKRVGFWWLWPVLKKGYKRTLHPDDLFVLTPELKVEYMYAQWEKHMSKIVGDLDESKPWPKYAIPWALFLTFKWQYTFSCVCLALAFVCIATSPLVTRQLIDFVEYKYFGVYTTYNRGIGLTFGAVILIFVNGLLLNHFFHNSMICGAQAKAILTKALLKKSFNLNSKSRYLFPAGRVTSLMSTDLSRIDLAIGFQPLVLCFPIPMIIAVIILVINIGVSALAGIGLFIVSLVVCVLLTKKLYTTREKVVKYTDERVSLMREILNNLKIIKFYAWEMAYKASILKIRHKEMKYLFTIKVLRNFITAYAVTMPVLTSMLSFITLWATDHMQTPGKVFSSLSLYAILAQAIMLLPIALSTGADALIGFQRCNDYLSAEEFTEEVNNKMLSYEDKFYTGEGEFNDIAIQAKHADFTWESHDDDLDVELWKEHPPKSAEKGIHESDAESLDTCASNHKFKGLTNVNLSIKNGEFVIITGVIGSGKTSLLNALAGFMKLSNGSIIRNKQVLLCSTTWIQNATVRENILFGKPYDAHRYKQVLFACALEDDVAILPAGDRTEIGERGITLSGGQKARINLARACYADAEVLLFDDVISAVDAKVARHIVIHLFRGLLRDKTIILATHQLGILEFADKVVFVDDGSVYSGSLDKLIAKRESFRSLVEHGKESSATEDDAEGDFANSDYEVQLPSQKLTKDEDYDLTGRTTTDEVRATNAISWSIYKKYIDLGSGIFGKFAAPLFVILVAIATFCQVFTNTWLSFWVENKFSGRSDHFYVAIYVMFAVLTVIFTGIEFSMLAYMQDCSANKLNLKAVEKILHAPMSFMDTTPLGRILNRFTKDTDSLDNEIGEQMRLFVFPMALIIGIIVLCSCYLPYFAIAIPFLGFAFVFLANFYQGSSREIKRLEATQRSLVYNNFNESLTGMETIKSFKAEDDFMKKNDYYINRMNEAYYLSIATQRWLCVHLDIITSSVALIVCMLCITGQFNISASSTGLLLNYVLQLVGVLSLTIRSMTQVENEMNSVERLHEYAYRLPQEAAYTREAQPPQEWPPSGYVTFKDVTLRYRPNLPPVLRHLNVNFYPGEKVGICGRTGAGKSSIMSALYRLIELEDGKIEIDGLDISTMGLYDLRSKLSIIPQDPVLFQGTIRRNLDPFNEHEDYKLWKALCTAGLISEDQIKQVASMKYSPEEGVGYNSLHKFHLDRIVDDDGANFSLGEKQLIALARALVRDSKILILDEATSSVDFATDSKIQDTISSEFRHCTVLCIAHRLKTILNYDRVLVMDKGEIVEKGDPWKLYQEKGTFRSMCDKANINENDF